MIKSMNLESDEPSLDSGFFDCLYVTIKLLIIMKKS